MMMANNINYCTRGQMKDKEIRNWIEFEKEITSMVKDGLKLNEVKTFLKMRTDTIPNDNPLMSNEKLIEDYFSKVLLKFRGLPLWKKESCTLKTNLKS